MANFLMYFWTLYVLSFYLFVNAARIQCIKHCIHVKDRLQNLNKSIIISDRVITLEMYSKKYEPELTTESDTTKTSGKKYFNLVSIHSY